MSVDAVHAAFAVVGLLASLSLYGAAGWIGARYAADEHPGPHPHRDDDEDTRPWPAPR